jgi:hypothetical protein
VRDGKIFSSNPAVLSVHFVGDISLRRRLHVRRSSEAFGNRRESREHGAIPLESWEALCDIKLNNNNLMMCDGKGGEPRMGKKLVYLSGVTLFALTVTFAGCGKKEEPAPPPPPPPAPAPAEPAPAPAPDAAAPAGDQKAGEPAKDGAMEKKEEKTK